jgi:hypothetical protein
VLIYPLTPLYLPLFVTYPLETPMTPIVEAAIHCFEQGWSPVPIVKGKKRPAYSDWPDTRYKTKNEIESAFADTNLGVILGDASNGLIDIDLDAPESVALADGFLPVTRMVHGRESSPRSHYWYRVEGWSVTTETFKDPLLAKTDPGNATIVEIRGTGGQTLLPPSVHPSGEEYKWFNGWHSPGVVSYKEINKQVRWLAAAALLSRYWPATGNRHDASMALAGGLLKLGDAELAQDAEAFVASVALVGGDEEGLDRQVDVESTRALIDKGRKVKGWPSLAKIIDPKVVRKVVEWLSPPSEDIAPEYGDGSMTRFTLTEYMTGEMKPHPMLVDNILYTSKVTWLQGEPGNGKTIFALYLAKVCVENGYRVMMIDEESGPKMTGERMAALGADPALIDSGFWYYPFSAINVLDPDHRTSFNTALEEAKPNFIIFDSVADVLAQSGLKENDNDDINSLIKHFVDPLRNQEVATLFIDHMTKSSVDSGWARGAGSKKSKADAAWTFTAIKAFDKNNIGKVSLKRAKDRLGQLPVSLLFNMGGNGEGLITVEQTEVAKEIATPKDDYEARIVEYLKEHATSEDEGLTTEELVKVVKGKTNNLYRALAVMKENISETPLEIVMHGNTKYWFYAGDLEIDWGFSE